MRWLRGGPRVAAARAAAVVNLSIGAGMASLIPRLLLETEFRVLSQ